MGFYPKHLKVRRHRWNTRIITTAGISGCMFRRCDPTLRITGLHRRRMGWMIEYDGKVSQMYYTKSEAASVYLIWWFQKQDMWPKRRIA